MDGAIQGETHSGGEGNLESRGQIYVLFFSVYKAFGGKAMVSRLLVSGSAT
jgi:hypothetical protein